MGSLASHPKVPSQPQYVPVYYTAPPASPPPSVPQDQNDSGDSDAPEAVAQRRAASLLDRSRGVLSTVLTGFRGVLSQTSTQPRKTLLGE